MQPARNNRLVWVVIAANLLTALVAVATNLATARPATDRRRRGHVARLLAVGWWQRDVTRSVDPAQINGGPGLVIRVDEEVDGVLAARVENGYVTGTYHVRNPEKPSLVEREVAVSR